MSTNTHSASAHHAPHSPEKQSEFFLGVTTILPLLFATFPIGLLFGTLATQKGLSALEATLMSAMVFAGGSQFVALDLWAHPLPWVSIMVSTLLVNLRLVLMGMSLGPKAAALRGPKGMIAYFFLTDESWALYERRVLTKPLSFSFYFGVATPFYLNWVASTFVGAFLGSQVADPAKWGLDFAFTALFTYLIMSFWRGKRTGITLAVSGLSAVVVQQLVPGAWYIMAGALAGMGSAAALYDPNAPQEAR
ncbi:AzlC family ABC transporter permease [Polycladidibacter hongkongensis]|uniref:AzlC family ABC transporter permease n=1 Tax=Polycladidibacter hongkongensis TaxID=1647556 RepID=UPI0009E9257A|nr:AzlC family ABC transporter permease [Pseudovibrio hongkongensis]